LLGFFFPCFSFPICINWLLLLAWLLSCYSDIWFAVPYGRAYYCPVFVLWQKLQLMFEISIWQWTSFSLQFLILHGAIVGIFIFSSASNTKKLHCPFFAYSQLAFFIEPKKVALDRISTMVRISCLLCFSNLATRWCSSSFSVTINVGIHELIELVLLYTAKIKSECSKIKYSMNSENLVYFIIADRIIFNFRLPVPREVFLFLLHWYRPFYLIFGMWCRFFLLTF